MLILTTCHVPQSIHLSHMAELILSPWLVPGQFAFSVYTPLRMNIPGWTRNASCLLSVDAYWHCTVTFIPSAPNLGCGYPQRFSHKLNNRNLEDRYLSLSASCTVILSRRIIEELTTTNTDSTAARIRSRPVANVLNVTSSTPTRLGLRRCFGKHRIVVVFPVSRVPTASKVDMEIDKNVVPKNLGELSIPVGRQRGEEAAAPQLDEFN